MYAAPLALRGEDPAIAGVLGALSRADARSKTDPNK